MVIAFLGELRVCVYVGEVWCVYVGEVCVYVSVCKIAWGEVN